MTQETTDVVMNLIISLRWPIVAVIISCLIYELIIKLQDRELTYKERCKEQPPTKPNAIPSQSVSKATQNVIDINTVYTVTNQMEMYSEKSRWNRFNAFLVVESIILVSWATLFSKTSNEAEFLLYILPIFGLLLGPVWAMLGDRSSKYQKKMHEDAMDLENSYLTDSSIKPYHSIHEVAEELRNGPSYKKLSSSTLIVTYVPLLFSLVFLVIIVLLARG